MLETPSEFQYVQRRYISSSCYVPHDTLELWETTGVVLSSMGFNMPKASTKNIQGKGLSCRTDPISQALFEVTMQAAKHSAATELTDFLAGSLHTLFLRTDCVSRIEFSRHYVLVSLQGRGSCTTL